MKTQKFKRKGIEELSLDKKTVSKFQKERVTGGSTYISYITMGPACVI